MDADLGVESVVSVHEAFRPVEQSLLRKQDVERARLKADVPLWGRRLALVGCSQQGVRKLLQELLLATPSENCHAVPPLSHLVNGDHELQSR